MSKMSNLHAESAPDRADAAEAELAELRAEVAALRGKLATLAEGDPAGVLREIARQCWAQDANSLRAVANAIDETTD